MSDFVLYNYFRSSTSYRTRIALYFKGVQFEYRPIHLLNNGGEQHTAEYRKLNPSGEVPTLVHNGRALGQSMAIFVYLETLLPQPALFPKDPFAKAKVMQICELVNSGLHPMTNLKVLQRLTKTHHFSEEAKDSWIQFWMQQGLDSLNQLVNTTKGIFAFGDGLTAADMFVIPHLFTARRYNVDLQPYAALLQVEKSCMNLDCFKRAHPMSQPDTPT
jgi:maleylacetoacetate isomerase